MEHTNYDSRGNEGLKKHCPISDSELCDWLGKKGCYQCYISTLKTETQKTDALERWKVTLSYLPDNIDDLHTSDECQFCKDEKPEKAQYYATFEMAHPEPYAEKGCLLYTSVYFQKERRCQKGGRQKHCDRKRRWNGIGIPSDQICTL